MTTMLKFVLLALGICAFHGTRAVPHPTPLRCYTCADEPNDSACELTSCTSMHQACHTSVKAGLITKSCLGMDLCRSQAGCQGDTCSYCCETDSCNRITPDQEPILTCDPPADPCSTKPCMNGGTCERRDGGEFVCVCPPGYEGDRCQTTLDPCDSSPCQNCGTCINDGPTQPRCKCLPWYTGPECEQYIDPCEPNPCQNGGSCDDDGNGGHHCECLPGYVGPLCGVDICNPNPCQNGGTCTGTVDPMCVCEPAYTGPFCGRVVNPGEGYTCQPESRSPCTQENIDAGWFYWPHPNPKKFVQCDEFGQCFVKDCRDGTTWDPVAYTCNSPELIVTPAP